MSKLAGINNVIKKYFKTGFKFLALSFKENKFCSIIILLISVIQGILPYASAKGFIILAKDDLKLIYIIIGIFLLIFSSIGYKLLSSLNNIATSKLSYCIDFKLKKDLKEKILKINYRDKENVKFKNDLTMAYNSIDTFGIIKMISIIPLIISNIVTLVSLSMLLAKYSIILMIYILLIMIITTLLRNKLDRKNIEKEKELINCKILEGTLLSNITNNNSYAELRINNSVDWAIEKWKNSKNFVYKKELKNNFNFQINNELINFIAHNFSFITSVILLIYLNKLSLAGTVALYAAVQNLINNCYIFSNEISITLQFMNLFSCYEKIFLYADSNLVYKEENYKSNNFKIIFDNVSFKYNEKYVLNNINFNICGGEKIAIIGYNGSGKSTILKLLTGLYKPTLGSINYIDYQENEKIAQSVVFQEYPKYKISLKDNICIYNDDKNKSLDFSSIFNKYHFNGLDIKDMDVIMAREFGGIEPSIGEWQKIAIARAKLKSKYDILIMDESTSAIDAFTEKLIMSDIINDSYTLIYVCHKLSNIKLFDKIIFIDSGSIIGIGNHDYLFKSNEKYKAYYLSQAQEYIE